MTKSVFKQETIKIKGIHIYSSLDRSNLNTRLHPYFPKDETLVKDVLYNQKACKNLEFTYPYGYNSNLSLKVIRIADFLCSIKGVRTYFYKMVGFEYALMYQKRTKVGEKDFIIVYPNLNHMFNDAIGSGKMNSHVYHDLDFAIDEGFSSIGLKRAVVKYMAAKNITKNISHITYGTYLSYESKYNIFIRNQPYLDENGKELKCKKKIIKLKNGNGAKIAFYSGQCESPIELKKHQYIKLVSEDGFLTYHLDILVLYSVEKDMYTVFTPSFLGSLTSTENKFHDLFKNENETNEIIAKIIKTVQERLNKQAVQEAQKNQATTK